MLLDIFKDNFTLQDMTDTMQILPNRYDRVTRLGLFEPKALTVPQVLVEENNGVLALVQTSPWGAPAVQHKTGKRGTRTFTVPHMPYEDMLQAADVMGVRQFGTSDQLQSVAAVVSTKLDEMKTNIDQTLEFRQFSALRGKVTDADNSTIIDLFAEYGVTQLSVNLNAAGATKDKILSIKRSIEDSLKGDVMTGVHCLCSPEYFDALTEKADVKAAYDNYQAAQDRLGGDMRSAFEYAGVVFEENRSQIGADRWLQSGEAIFFPLGTRNTFRNFMAPADFVETVNTIALPYYAKQWITPDGRGVMIHMQANHLPICMRPAVLVKGTLA